MMKLLACMNDLVVRGSDDWVQAYEVAYVARTAGGATTPEEIRQLSIETIREVLRAGLMVVGDVTHDGFHEWDLSPDETLGRIEREWIAHGNSPDLGEVCWLSNTEQGDEMARRLAGGAT